MISFWGAVTVVSINATITSVATYFKIQHNASGFWFHFGIFVAVLASYSAYVLGFEFNPEGATWQTVLQLILSVAMWSAMGWLSIIGSVNMIGQPVANKLSSVKRSFSSNV